ncbi:MAG: radical SAM protein [Candidatus Diapherotrites archaeon]
MRLIEKYLVYLRFLKSFGLVKRAAKGKIRALTNGTVLRNLQFCVTYKCNFNCEFCSCSTLREPRREMALEEWKKVWDDAYSLGAIHADITGGEPMTMGIDWLCELVSHITKNNDVICSTVTNASLLTEEKIDRLKKAGLDVLEISIHSMDPERHEGWNGQKGSLQQAINMALYARKAGLNVCISSVLSSDSFGDIEEVAKFCEQHGFLHLIQLAAAVGNWHGENEKEIDAYKERYYALLKKYPGMRDDRYTNFRRFNICPGGMEKWYVTPYGEVMQCSFVGISYGNLLKESARTIYDRIKSYEFMRKECADCKRTFDRDFIENVYSTVKGRKKIPVSIAEIEKNNKAYFKRG